MANPLLLDIATFLEENNIVQGDGVDTFRDFMPEAPDSVIVLTEYQGDPAIPYDTTVHRSVQVTVRDKDADAAREKARDIYNSLYSENLIVTFTEDRWGQVYLRQTPFKLKMDESFRTIYCFNIGITTTNE